MVDVTSSANVGYDQLDNFDLFQNVQFDDIFSEIMGECDLSTFEFGPDASNNSASEYASFTANQNYQLVQLKDPASLPDSGLDTADSSSSPESSNASPVPQEGSPSSSQLDENSVQFSYTAEQKLLNASMALPSEPISIILPETEKDGVKITSEIILNFDQIDENRILDQISHLSAELDSGKESQNEQETCIELSQSMDSSEDEDDMDVSVSLQWRNCSLK